LKVDRDSLTNFEKPALIDVVGNIKKSYATKNVKNEFVDNGAHLMTI